jgi:hypothetical protein
MALFFAMSSTLIMMEWDDEPPERDTLIDLLAVFTIGGFERLLTTRPDVIEGLG